MASKGLIHIYTGDGKGKTTAAIGLAVRAAGHSKKVLFVQFFKEDGAASGEKVFFRAAAPTIELIRSNCRHPIFTKDKTDMSKVQGSVAETFNLVKEKVSKGGAFDLLVLDEVMAAINGGWLKLEGLIEFLNTRPVNLEVVLTGRDAPLQLVRLSDYVTEMLKIKHPFDAGVGARQGVEF